MNNMVCANVQQYLLFVYKFLCHLIQLKNNYYGMLSLILFSFLH